MTALGNLMRWQRVNYDFKFHSQEFTADVPVLTLSEGKSLLPVSIGLTKVGLWCSCSETQDD